METIISLCMSKDKNTAIKIKNNKIGFASLPSDYSIKDSVRVILNNKRQEKLILLFDNWGYGACMDDYLEVCKKEGFFNKYSFKKEANNLLTQSEELESIIMDFAMNSHLNDYNKIEFKKMLREYNNIEMKVNQLGNVYMYPKNKNISMDRLECFIQFLYYIKENNHLNTLEDVENYLFDFAL